ncbi:MAG: dimethylsulfoxide reductase subunit B [Candidatus Aminicenantes bacterium]
MAKQLAFYFDSSHCSGCKACQMACKDKHDLDVGLNWRRVYEISGGQWENQGNAWIPHIFAYNLSIACNHCAKPVCRDVCPTGAITKRKDGIVLIDKNKCMGCRYCEWACPYGALQFDKASGTMTKCHFCFDNIDEGKIPACISACPQRALDFGELSELKKNYHGTDNVHPLPDPALTDPAIVINPHKDAERARAENAEIANREEV